jgi:release factor glutamine methyltransferase
MTEREYILTHILNCSRADLYLNKFPAEEKYTTELSRIMQRRKQGEPVQYITGSCEFMGLDFKVDDRVLIPRPETEILVEEAIKIVQKESKAQNILDIGTGSGNICVSLAKYLPGCKITAVDISQAAIKLARQNAWLNLVEERIEFMVSDLFAALDASSSFDMIISNPPYISTEGMKDLPAEVRYEPRLALEAGPEGLDFYRRIIEGCPAQLKKGGMVLLEMGYNQSGAIRKIFEQSGNFKILEIIRDYRDIERVIIAQKG